MTPSLFKNSCRSLIERQHPMNVDNELLAEIKNQLQDDILHFGWLRQIVLVRNPHRTRSDQTEAIVDAIIQLHRAGAIIVGHARVHDGTVLIDPWPECNSELRSKLESTVDHANERDRDFCFWIQLADHASRDAS